MNAICSQVTRCIVASPLSKHTLISVLEDQGLSPHPDCGRPASSSPQTAKSPAKAIKTKAECIKIDTGEKENDDSRSVLIRIYILLIWKALRNLLKTAEKQYYKVFGERKDNRKFLQCVTLK